MKKLFLLLLLPVCAWSSAPNVLSNTSHAANNITSAIAALGGTSIVDQTCGSGTDNCGGGSSFLLPGLPFVDYALGAGPFFTAGTNTSVNDQPYTVLTESSTQYSPLVDQASYTVLMANSMIYSMPHCPVLPVVNDYPPPAMVNVLPAGSGPAPGCGYDGGTEFSISANYLYSGSAATPSASGGTMAGILAVMKEKHPTWTWNDIKAALRQTASNWNTGYTPNNGGALGFGNVNYAAATAVANTAAIYLQAPGMAIANHNYYATITLYPFLTTRRAKEVVYIGGIWPAASAGNELTAAQIASAGGTKIVDDGGATGVQAFTYAPAATGSATFTVLTLDASGNGSRVETFSQISESFVVGAGCFQ